MDEREKNKQVKHDDRGQLPPHGDPVRTKQRGAGNGEGNMETDRTDESVGADRDSKATGQL